MAGGVADEQRAGYVRHQPSERPQRLAVEALDGHVDPVREAAEHLGDLGDQVGVRRRVLELEEETGSARPECLEDLLERRHPLARVRGPEPGAGVQRPDLGVGEGGDRGVRPVRSPLPEVRGPREAGVVDDDGHPVARGLHVDLDGVGTPRYRCGDSGERVLRSHRAGAPVGDDSWSPHRGDVLVHASSVPVVGGASEGCGWTADEPCLWVRSWLGRKYANICSMNGEATILHADLDSFFASVEQRDDPALRGRPVLVGGGVVVAASYEAKAYGVRTPMGIVEAKSLCPGAVVASPRFEAYSAASKAVFEVFRDTTPLVDPVSIDEAFLEVGGLARLVGSPESIGARLRQRVREEVGLPITVGVARTKFLAKIASAFAKPDGLLVVPVDGERAFLHPLPVERMWGVGAKTGAKLRARGIDRIGDLAAVPPHALAAYVGHAAAYHLHALANGQDPRPVQTGRRRRSVGAQRALGRRPRVDHGRAMADIDSALAGLVDRVARRMRKAEREGRTVTLRLRFDDFTRATRSHTLPRPTARTDRILLVARSLLDAAEPMIRERGCTLVGVAVSGFDAYEGVQLELPFGEPDTASLDLALDDVRERFGSSAVLRGSLVRRGEGYAMPTLPD